MYPDRETLDGKIDEEKKFDKSEMVKKKAYMTTDASLRWMETSHDDVTLRVLLKIKKRDLPTDQPMRRCGDCLGESKNR